MKTSGRYILVPKLHALPEKSLQATCTGAAPNISSTHEQLWRRILAPHAAHVHGIHGVSTVSIMAHRYRHGPPAELATALARAGRFQ